MLTLDVFADGEAFVATLQLEGTTIEFDLFFGVRYGSHNRSELLPDPLTPPATLHQQAAFDGTPQEVHLLGVTEQPVDDLVCHLLFEHRQSRAHLPADVVTDGLAGSQIVHLA